MPLPIVSERIKNTLTNLKGDIRNFIVISLIDIKRIIGRYFRDFAVSVSANADRRG